MPKRLPARPAGVNGGARGLYITMVLAGPPVPERGRTAGTIERAATLPSYAPARSSVNAAGASKRAGLFY